MRQVKVKSEYIKSRKKHITKRKGLITLIKLKN